MKIGENIKKHRKALGMTQKELAELVGLKQYMIAKYESGERTPIVARIEKISDILKISTDELLGIKEKQQSIVVPKKSSREGKLMEAFKKLKPAQQRVIVQQAQALARE